VKVYRLEVCIGEVGMAAGVVARIMVPLPSGCTSAKKDCEGCCIFVVVGTAWRDCTRVAATTADSSPLELPSLDSSGLISTSYYNSPAACFTDKID
jgi:hypothetical protein